MTYTCKSIWNSAQSTRKAMCQLQWRLPTSILPWLLAVREEWERRMELNMLITVAFLPWLHPIFRKQLKAEQRLAAFFTTITPSTYNSIGTDKQQLFNKCLLNKCMCGFPYLTFVKINNHFAFVSTYKLGTRSPARLSDLPVNTQPVNKTARLKGQNPCSFLPLCYFLDKYISCPIFQNGFFFLASRAVPGCRIISEFYDSHLNHGTVQQLKGTFDVIVTSHPLWKFPLQCLSRKYLNASSDGTLIFFLFN